MNRPPFKQPNAELPIAMQMIRLLNTPWLPGTAAALATCLALAPAAHAGQWQLEKYVYSGGFASEAFGMQNHTTMNSHEVSNTRQAGNTWAAEGDRGEVPASSSDSFNGWARWVVSDSVNSAPSGPQKDPPKGRAVCNFTVHAVWRWERNLKYEYDPETYEEHEYPDPNDNPPEYTWVYETAEAQAVRSNGRGGVIPPYEYMYSEAHPYKGENTTIEALDCKFGTERGHYEALPQVPGGGSGFWFNSVTDRKTGWNLTKISTQGKDVISLPSATIAGQLSIPDLDYTDGMTLSAWVSGSYRAVPVSFSLGTASGAIFAGAKTTDDHKTKVVLGVYSDWTEAISGIPLEKLPTLQIVSPTGQGVEQDGVAELLGAPADAPDNGKTDYYGNVIVDVLKSSDITSSGSGIGSPVVGLEFVKGKIEPAPRITVSQRWTSVTWRKGENGEEGWNDDDQFVITDEGAKEWIWARVDFDAASAMAVHDLKFVAQRVVVRELDPLTQQPVTIIFTTDPQEVGQHTDEPDVSVIYADDIDQSIQPYLGLPAATPAGDGAYKGELTIKTGKDFVVQSYRLGLKDMDVFRRRGE